MATTWNPNSCGEATTLDGGLYGVVSENSDLDGFEWAVYLNYSGWSYGDTPEGCGTADTRRDAREQAQAYATNFAALVS